MIANDENIWSGRQDARPLFPTAKAPGKPRVGPRRNRRVNGYVSQHGMSGKSPAGPFSTYLLQCADAGFQRDRHHSSTGLQPLLGPVSCRRREHLVRPTHLKSRERLFLSFDLGA